MEKTRLELNIDKAVTNIRQQLKIAKPDCLGVIEVYEDSVVRCWIQDAHGNQNCATRYGGEFGLKKKINVFRCKNNQELDGKAFAKYINSNINFLVSE